MSWFKVDDKLHSHKKAARAGVAAMGLWTVAGSWCADHLTDGFVPDYIASRLAPEAEDLAARLVDAGLWIEAEHDGDRGWLFHGWDEYQPTRDDVESRREYERDKKRRQRRNDKGQFSESHRESPTVSRRDTRGKSTGESTRPVPSRPDREENTTGAADATRKRSRPPDLLFDAVTAACGIDPKMLTASGRGPLNRALKEIRDVGGSPDEVPRRAAEFRRRFPEASLTPSALAKHWGSLASAGRPRSSTGPPVVGSPEWEARQRAEQERAERLAGEA